MSKKLFAFKNIMFLAVIITVMVGCGSGRTNTQEQTKNPIIVPIVEATASESYGTRSGKANVLEPIATGEKIKKASKFLMGDYIRTKGQI